MTTMENRNVMCVHTVSIGIDLWKISPRETMTSCECIVVRERINV